jgi:hypothetical protein
MCLEIGSRSFVLRVLESSDSTSWYLAFASGTREKMAETAVVLLNQDIGLEKAVNWRAPGALEGI